MQELGFKSRNADHDPWMKPEFRSEDKSACYSYILCYVGEISCIHNDLDDVLIKLNHYVPLKPSSVSRFDFYFGTIQMYMQLHNVH